MEGIIHKITKSEIDYGILCILKREWRLYNLFQDRFDMVMDGIWLYDRHIAVRRVWIGKQIMKRYKPNDPILMRLDGNVMTINKVTPSERKNH